MGKMNYETKTFTSDSGIEIKLKPVPYMLIAGLQTDTTGQPKPPIIEMNIMGRTVAEENYNDPEYQKRLRNWENNRSMHMTRAILAFGTDIQPDPEWVADYGGFMINPTRVNLRVYWLMSILTNDETNQIFTEIIAMTAPTQEGLAEAGAQFPRDN